MEAKNKSFSVLWQLGRRIAFLRKQRHLSQLALSIDAEIAKSYLSDLERGERNPSVLVLNKIATALGITLSELFQGVVSLDALSMDEGK